VVTWPDVAVLIPTFNRAEIVSRTVELVASNLRYSGHVAIYVGCDGDDDTPDRLAGLPCTVIARRAGGIGANVNRLVKTARRAGCSLFITMDDDHHLAQPLSLDRHAMKLTRDTGAGRIHLLMEAVNDEHFDPYQFTATLDHDHYWRVHWDSPEHFIMSFRPNLTHSRWWEVMGYLPEGLKTGETEWTYAQHCKSIGRSAGGVNVLVPLCAYGYDHWQHNNGGKSWNHSGL
jgi:glycosyltransferase involved in cell wall biosynthesis